MDAKFYPTSARNWDDSLFRDRIIMKLTPESTVLDLGAGAGIVSQMDFRGHAARICGVDLDSRVEQNPFLDEGRVADGRPFPIPTPRSISYSPTMCWSIWPIRSAFSSRCRAC